MECVRAKRAVVFCLGVRCGGVVVVCLRVGCGVVGVCSSESRTADDNCFLRFFAIPSCVDVVGSELMKGCWKNVKKDRA